MHRSSQSIGTSGGTVSGPDAAKVVVPAGALASGVNIAVTQSSDGASALAAGVTSVSKMYAFAPHGTSFTQPVTITVPFDPAQLPVGATPVLIKTNAQGAWEVLNGVTIGTNTLTAQVSSFSWASAGFRTPASGNGGTAFITFFDATPSNGNGTLMVSSVQVETLACTAAHGQCGGSVYYQ